MGTLHYSCQKEKLHPGLRKVFSEKKIDKKTLDFQHRKTPLYSIKFFIFIFMSVLGFKHYNTMGLLGYETFLFDETFVGKLIGKRKKRTLLDIGAGDGSITKNFEPSTSYIACLEPSASFQRILKKRGYSISSMGDRKTYDIITVFNVLDICEKPKSLIQAARKHLTTDGLLIITLPFPIKTRSWDITNIQRTNHLGQSQNLSFEEAVSSFYTNFLKKNHLEVTYFTRLPYIVSLPEAQKTTVHDNGLFVCHKARS